jgi:phage baseplate assembly protein W
MIINVNSNSAINWQATGYDKIADNIANILKTRISEVPYMREMGIDPDYMDMPVSEVKGQIISDAIEAISTYESRAEVVEIDVIEATAEGDLIIKVVIEV